jgi:phage anti-repressor protein
MEIVKIEDKNLVMAREVWHELGMKRKFSDWIQLSIERAYLEEGKDFFTYLGNNPNRGRPTKEYLLTKDAAINIIVMSGGQFARTVREKVLNLYKKFDSGLAYTTEQVESLIDISKAVTLVSIQKDVERKHFDLYNNKYEWHRYRAALLGYDTEDVIRAMREVNRKYHSMRASLLALDANELIRVGVIDFMIAMGKDVEYATNCGNFCKMMAEKMELGRIIWDDTKPNPIGLNSQSIQDRKRLYEQKLIGK